MEELSTEEKAKRYDEALKLIKECTPDENGFVIIYPKDIFPELKESEDERIRKALINKIKCLDEEESKEGYSFYAGDYTADDCIAWLEKQGEHHIACSKEQMKVLDEVLKFAANHENPYWNNYIFETLNNLIRQLKKVKE